MGGRSPKAPKAPDPYKTAEAQYIFNKKAALDQARFNQFSQDTPFGSVSYTGEVGSPDRRQITTLNPELQGLLDSSIANQRFIADNSRPLQQKVFDAAADFGFGSLPQVRRRGGIVDLKLPERNAIDLRTGLPQLPNPDSYGEEVRKASDAIFQRGYNRLNPIISQQNEDLENKLSERGLAPSSIAALKSRDRLGSQHSDLLENLALSADTAGRAEHSRLSGLTMGIRSQLFNEGMSEEQFKEAQRRAGFSELLSKEQFKEQQKQARFGEDFQLRQQLANEKVLENQIPLQSLATLTGLAPPPGLPQFTPFSPVSINAPDYQGAVNSNYQAQMGAHNSAQQRKGSALGGITSGLGSLGGSLLSAGPGSLAMSFLSDDRLKENIISIGQIGKLNLYEFNYTFEPDKKHTGFLASEVEEINPSAIIYKNGVRYVDYNKAMKEAV